MKLLKISFLIFLFVLFTTPSFAATPINSYYLSKIVESLKPTVYPASQYYSPSTPYYTGKYFSGDPKYAPSSLNPNSSNYNPTNSLNLKDPLSSLGEKALDPIGKNNAISDLLKTLSNPSGVNTSLNQTQAPQTPIQAQFGTDNPSLSAIRDFQRQNGLTPDGIIGPKTYDALTKANPNSTPKPDNSTITQQPDQKSPESNSPVQMPSDCKNGSLNGNMNEMLACGKASTFGHTTTGKKDNSPDDGNTWCNDKGEKSGYTYLPNRPASENLKVCVAALRINDIAKLIGVKPEATQSKTLAKIGRSWCRNKIRVTDTSTGKSVEALLMDTMSNNDKVVDLSGCAMKELNKNSEEPTLKSVIVTWAKQPPLTNQNVAKNK